MMSIKICSREDVIKQMKEHGLQFIQVEDGNGERFMLKEKVLLLNIRGESSVQEKRYIGEVYFQESPMESNPVTFTLEKGEEYYLPFLIDGDRDGMIFCKMCQEVFWRLGDGDHKEHHFIPEKIFVELNQDL